MKLILVTDAWHPQVNGVVTTLSSIVKDIEQRGHEVFVIEPRLFKTVSLPFYSEIKISLNRRKVKELLQSLVFDHIHIATEGPLGFAARSYLVKNKISFSSSIHTKFPEYLEKYIFLPPRFGYKIMRWFHAPASKTLVNTQSQIEDLYGRGFKNLKLWCRAFDKGLFFPRARKAIEPYLLYVGRVSKEKNIEAFLRFDSSYKKVVVGGGPMLLDYKKRYPNVDFKGPKFGEELAQIYSDAKVFVFPSLTDTFGVVMLEAIACGTPVAAYPVTGPKDLLVSGRNGEVHKNLGKAIEKALSIDSQSCCSSISQYSWKKVADVFLESLVFANDLSKQS